MNHIETLKELRDWLEEGWDNKLVGNKIAALDYCITLMEIEEVNCNHVVGKIGKCKMCFPDSPEKEEKEELRPTMCYYKSGEATKIALESDEWPKLDLKEITAAGLELKEKLLDLNFAVEDFLQALNKKVAYEELKKRK